MWSVWMNEQGLSALYGKNEWQVAGQEKKGVKESETQRGVRQKWRHGKSQCPFYLRAEYFLCYLFSPGLYIPLSTFYSLHCPICFHSIDLVLNSSSIGRYSPFHMIDFFPYTLIFPTGPLSKPWDRWAIGIGSPFCSLGPPHAPGKVLCLSAVYCNHLGLSLQVGFETFGQIFCTYYDLMVIYVW